MAAPPSPTVLAGKFRLVRKLGEGGMGAVWQADHLVLHSKVAIKLMGPEVAQDKEALTRFLREAQAAAALRSPHVVQILDYGVDDDTPYIAMELLEGESLADRLERLGTLSPEETARVITHMARAMTRAHESGIVHRDLKPDNVFITNDEEQIAKLLDFGIAKSTAHGLASGIDKATRTGAVLGSPYYMSPEQAEGLKTLDYRTDIWSMGVIAYECLLGKRPFDSDSLGGLVLAICTRPIPVPSAVGPVPSGFDVWFAKACARDPKQRYDSAKHAAAVLRELCQGKIVPGAVASSTRSAGGVPSTTQLAASQNVASGERRRSPRLLLITGIGACVLGIGGVASYRMTRGDFAASGRASAQAVLPESPRPSAAPTETGTPTMTPEAPIEATPTPEPAPAPAESASATGVASAAPSVQPPPVRQRPRRAPRPAAPARSAAPARPRVNLGI